MLQTVIFICIHTLYENEYRYALHVITNIYLYRYIYIGDYIYF
jgi:hypothetical protein